MKFSAQEEYGLRCMVAIAREGDDGFMTIPTIAKAEGLTHSHVAKLLAVLRKADFVVSTRGKLGGYALSRPAGAINVSDMLEALGGRLIDERYCERHSGIRDECAHYGLCALWPLWEKVQQAVDDVVSGLSLRDLVESEAGSNVELYANGRPKVEA